MHASDQQKPRRSATGWTRLRAIGLAILIALIAFLLQWQSAKSPEKQTNHLQKSSLETHAHQLLGPKKVNASVTGPILEPAGSPAPLKYPTLTNLPMRLTKKVLVSKKWNSGPDAFGLDKPPAGKEGATVGPAAVTYFDGKLYVLDNPNKRILAYDPAGNLLSSIDLPNNVATDLSVDASGSSLILIDHMNDSVYKINGNELVLLSSLPLKENFPLGTKFSYDPASDTLSTEEVHQDGLADIEGSNLILNQKDGTRLSIPFDKPVACVEEIVTDRNGITWVLYTLEGDYQMRRIARVDRAHGTVGTAEVDVYFAFDATRHMAATGNGIVLFGGDNREGRLIAFNYAGNGF